MEDVDDREIRGDVGLYAEYADEKSWPANRDSGESLPSVKRFVLPRLILFFVLKIE